MIAIKKIEMYQKVKQEQKNDGQQAMVHACTKQNYQMKCH